MSASTTLELLLDPGYRLPLLTGLIAVSLLSLLSVYVSGARLLITGLALAQVAGLGAALALVLPLPGAALAIGFSATAAGLTPLLHRRNLPSDAGLLLLFLGSGAGACVLAAASGQGENQLLDLINGQLLLVGPIEAVSLAVTCGLVGILWHLGRSILLVKLTQPDIAPQLGLPLRRWEQLALLSLGAAVGAALPALGLQLTVATLTCPGLIALSLGRNLRSLPGIALSAGIGGYLVGVLLAFTTDWPPGPTIAVILVGETLVVLSVSAVGGAWRAREAGLRRTL